MRGFSRFFLYLKYFFEPEDKLVQSLAFEAAKSHYAKLPLRSAKTPYPRVADYYRRQEEFRGFQRAYNNSYRHSYATTKLSQLH
jgi:hypothetical protein